MDMTHSNISGIGEIAGRKTYLKHLLLLESQNQERLALLGKLKIFPEHSRPS